MRLKLLTTPDKGLPIADSMGNQRVCGIIIDDGSFILLIVDRVKSSMFIERVINKFAANMFESSNLEVVTDEEFKAYYDFFVANGLYQQEKKVSISKDEIIGSRR